MRLNRKNKFIKAIGFEPEIYDIIEGDIIIHSKEKRTLDISILDTHVSIFDTIIKNLEIKDLLTLRCVNHNLYANISRKYIFETMLQNMSYQCIIALCIHNKNISYLLDFINIYRNIINDRYLIMTLLYCISKHYHDMCFIIINIISLPLSSKYDNYNLYLPIIKGDYNCLYCCKEYINISNRYYNMECHSLRQLLQACCSVDNVIIFKHLISTYNIEFTHACLLICLDINSYNILAEVQKSYPNYKISSRTIKNFIYSYGLITDKIMSLKTILELGLVKCTRKLFNILNKYLSNYYLSNNYFLNYDDSCCDIYIISKFIDDYASQDILQTTFNYCIYYCLYEYILNLISISKRIVYTKKHLDMIDKNKDFWNHYPKVEESIYNKYMLQMRK